VVRLFKISSSVLILGFVLSSCIHFKDETIKNKSGGDNPGNGGTTSIVAIPVVVPGTGKINPNTEITIICETDGASIYYNTGDGAQANPDQSTGTLYDPQHKPIITTETTIKAKAFKSGYTASATAVVVYSFSKIIAGGEFSLYFDGSRNYISGLNSNGIMDTSFNPGLGPNQGVIKMTLQENGKILIGGRFTYYNGVARNKIARLNSDGSLDLSFDPQDGANGDINAITVQSDGKILIGGSFSSYNGTPRNFMARINSDGSLDDSFDPAVGTDDAVSTIVLQSNGKILIGGGFLTYRGIPSKYIARLNSDGALDTSFVPASDIDNAITSVVLQNDGKILIAGFFSIYGGVGSNRIARINSNGTIDMSFSPVSGANDQVNSMAVQSDGKIVICGFFTTYDGYSRNSIARINSNGTLDTSFDPGTGTDNYLWTVALQVDGKILIEGDFDFYNGFPITNVARLNSDGSLDESFNTLSAYFEAYSMIIRSDGKVVIGGWFNYRNNRSVHNYIAGLNSNGTMNTAFGLGLGLDGTIYSMAKQSDDKIIIAGQFSSYDGIPRNSIARINIDGSLDNSFNPGSGVSGYLNSVIVQNDGKIVIGGSFTSYDGVDRNGIARVNSDGSLDTSFEVLDGLSTDGVVESIALQSDGKILIGGYFTSYRGVPRNNIARINSNGSLDPIFNPGDGADYDVFSHISTK